MTQASATEPSHAVLEQAAEWYACLRDGKAGASERSAWQAWLDAAEEHATAWRYVEEISSGFEPVRSVPDPRQAAQQLSAANQRLHARRHLLASLALLAGGGLLGWASWRQAWLPPGLMAWAADHRSGTGEQRELALADGSRLWLNTASAIDIHFSARERRIALVAGEVFIETAADAARPFLVETSHGQMRALGTRFNVRLLGESTHLAVYQGAVEIRSAGNGTTIIIPAGRQADFNRDGIGAASTADIAREAWTQGTLVADNIPLREVIAELRRYRKGHLGVADEVAELKVYGNFPIGDTDRVLRMLASALPIRIEQPLPWWTSVEAGR